MATYSIELKGLDEMSKALRQMNYGLQREIPNLVKQYTEMLKEKTWRYAPRDTGYLKDHIVTYYPKPSQGIVESQAFYSGFNEFGTRYRPPKPYMEPATRETFPRFTNELLSLIGRSLK